jgi:DNA primase
MVVVEGYFDCLSLHQNGIENVVASCGTSLTPQQVAVLARFVPEVVMNYDPDSAGQSATKRSIELLLERNLTVRILRLPDGLDPDDFVRREGADAYRRLLDQAPYFWEQLIADARAQPDISQPEVKSRVVREIIQHVDHIPDRLVKLEVAKALAENFAIPTDVVFEQFKLRGKSRDRDLRSAPTRSRNLTLAEKQLIQALLQDPEISTSLKPFLENDFLAGIRSGGVLKRLIDGGSSGVESALEGIEDTELEQQVRAAALEPFTRIGHEVAIVSMGQLYQEYLVKKEEEIRAELKTYGTGVAPPDLVRKQMDIATEKSRIKAIRP